MEADDEADELKETVVELETDEEYEVEADEVNVEVIDEVDEEEEVVPI